MSEQLLESPLTTPLTVATVSDSGAPKIEPGSVLAQSLYSVWSGKKVTVVDSPPGAGKSTLSVELVATLLLRAEFAIEVVAPTRNGAFDLCRRLDNVFETQGLPNEERPWVMTSARIDPHGAFDNTNGYTGPCVRVGTVAAAQISQPEVDIMIFDEAYQTTFTNAAIAAENADQVFMVGDPGQIGPVVRSDTSLWERNIAAPHRRAPEVFSRMDGAVVLKMEGSYRLGAASVELIAPLYDFSFESKRPSFDIESEGSALNEISVWKLKKSPDDIADLGLMRAIRKRALTYLDMEIVDRGESRTVTPADIAIVVAHNDQSESLRVLLDEDGFTDVTVGTADSLQGGQWPIVLALDPLVGHDVAGDFQTTTGRLCVMLSRHIGHVLWIHDGKSAGKLKNEGSDDARLGVKVRERVEAWS